MRATTIGDQVHFSRNQLKLVIRAMDEAEEYTSSYYCIPPHKWQQQLRYDLLTSRDSEWEPLPMPVLAKLQHVEKLAGHKAEPFDFYRIQLNDAGILDVAKREKLDCDLYSFLVMILTHEMVHLVRLGTMLYGHAGIALSPDDEENRVRRISSQILTKSEHNSLMPFFDKFCSPVPQGG